MALLRPLLTALALLTCRPGGSLGCALPGSHAQVSRDNLVLLGQMRRLSPFLCLRARKDFRFPREMLEGGQLREAQAAAAVLRELLQQTFNLLHTERSSAAWSPAPLHGLRSGLHRQLEALDACLVNPQERVGVGEGRKAKFDPKFDLGPGSWPAGRELPCEGFVLPLSVLGSPVSLHVQHLAHHRHGGIHSGPPAIHQDTETSQPTWF
ncbi:interferon omega-1-like [Prionailurus viverrinus]|uniref:interferon omega-1-like n=1 Tax=Prionailurus viverrinus TaxID=61388 RepID=UPI001FF607B9|nr:interferon omega-1-like [Prionailurus viverrinus]